MMISPWMAIFPGLAIVATVLSISLAADGLADYFDPKLGHGKFRRVPLARREGQGGRREAGGGAPLPLRRERGWGEGPTPTENRSSAWRSSQGRPATSSSA
jgi:hypothetical protein